MSAQPLIIDAHHNQTWVQRWTGWLVTLICWTLWCWLWWPYARNTLPLDPLFQALPVSVPAPPAPHGPGVEYLFEQAALILLAGALLVLWALVHTWRFANVTRRRGTTPTSFEQLAQAMGLAPDLLDQARASQCVIAHHHESGGLQKLETVDTPWVVPRDWIRWQPTSTTPAKPAMGTG